MITQTHSCWAETVILLNSTSAQECPRYEAGAFTQTSFKKPTRSSGACVGLTIALNQSKI